MALHILKNSHKWHKTAEETTVQVSYLMTMLDRDRGYGDLYFDENIYMYTMSLPQIGTNYLNFYGFVEDGFNAMYQNARDLYCVDITEEPAQASELWDDQLLLNRDELRTVVYTFSNRGRYEEIVPDDISSMRYIRTTINEINNNDIYFEAGDQKIDPGDTDFATAKYFAKEYYTAKNPTIYFYGTDSNGKPTIETIGEFNSQTDAWKKWYIDNYPAPPTETHKTTTLLTIKLYSRSNWDKILNAATNRINSDDFLKSIVKDKHDRLRSKGKQIPFFDILSEIDDTKKWRFDNWKIDEYSPSVFEYTLEFIFKADGWDKEYGITTNKYKTMAMEEFILSLLVTED